MLLWADQDLWASHLWWPTPDGKRKHVTYWNRENYREKQDKSVKNCNWLTELVQYRLMSSLMAISFLCNLGPVWYHPTILSLAEISKDDRYKIMQQHARSTSVYKTLTINFFEHAIHVLQVVMIQEPHRVIPVIFIKWYWGGSEGMEIRAKTMIALQQPTAIITLLKPTSLINLM